MGVPGYTVFIASLQPIGQLGVKVTTVMRLWLGAERISRQSTLLREWSGQLTGQGTELYCFSDEWGRKRTPASHACPPTVDFL